MNKINHILPAPTKCPKCNSRRVLLCYSRLISEHLYKCGKCGASVWCHKDTIIPMGYMAGKTIRTLRCKAHDTTDLLWKSGPMSRENVYRWIGEVTDRKYEDSHIGMLTEQELRLVIKLGPEKYRKLISAKKKKGRNPDAKFIRIRRSKQKRQRKNG